MRRGPTYTERVTHGLKGLEAVSTGVASSCEDCRREYGYLVETWEGDNRGRWREYNWLAKHSEPTYHATYEQAAAASAQRFQDDLDTNTVVPEPSFSWSHCDICGSTLGGDREEWHAFDRETGATYHFRNACIDCVLYLANGDIPEGEE